MTIGQHQFDLGAAKPILEAVINRLIPADDWPSASEEGVLEYLQTRFETDSDSWTTLILPGLLALDTEAKLRHGPSFSALPTTEQDTLLRSVEHGKVENWAVPSRNFFTFLLHLVIEGYYGSTVDSASAHRDPTLGTSENTLDAGARPRTRKSWDMIGFRPDPISGSQFPVAETDLLTIPFDEVRDRYDAIVVGAGAGGSVAAAVLAEAGMQVLVVERGSWLSYREVGRDHASNHRFSKYGHNTGPGGDHPRTFLTQSGDERVTSPFDGNYHNNAMTVGGGTRVYGAQAWRFHPDDFRMATRYGVPEGSSLADWPIRYEDLEPFYDLAEWSVGVSGDGLAHPGRGSRRRPYPMPPLSLTLEAKHLAQGAAKLGWDVGPVPLLINSVDRDGRPPCGRCGECVGFACPTNSKNGGHNTMLVRALATGNCHLVTDTMAVRIETEGGRHATGIRLAKAVAGLAGGGSVVRKHVHAGHVVVAAGAIESARLLLNSNSDVEPDGLGNRNGLVGRNLQGHVYSGAYALFDHPVQDGLGPGVSIATCQFAHGNSNGVIGGGMLANEFTRLPLIHWYRALAADAPRWGMAGKVTMRETYLRTSHVQGPIQEIPTAEARVRLSPTVKDPFGLPVAQLSGEVHPESVKAANMLAQQAERWLEAAGAKRVWRTHPGTGLSAGQHQAGTLRMGHDPATSVTDPSGRIHGYDNLWVSDGSVHVTNGGVNPVLTILALAFRTAENVVKES